MFYVNCNKYSIEQAIESVIKEDPSHVTLQIELEYSSNNKNMVNYLDDFNYFKYDFINADYNLIYKEIERIRWEILFKDANLEQSVDIFYSNIEEIINKFVKKNRIKFSTYPVWFSNELKGLLIQKKSKS